jgi:hypothetical protein
LGIPPPETLTSSNIQTSIPKPLTQPKYNQ